MLTQSGVAFPAGEDVNTHFAGIIVVLVALGILELRNLDTRWRWLTVVLISAFVAVAFEGLLGVGEAVRSWLAGILNRNGYPEFAGESFLAVVLVLLIVLVIVSQEKQLRRGDKPGKWAFVPLPILTLLLCTFSVVARAANWLSGLAAEVLVWVLALF